MEFSMSTAFEYINNFRLNIYIESPVQSKNIFYINQMKKNSIVYLDYKFISVTNGIETSSDGNE